MRRLVVDLRVAFDDIDGIVGDMLRPARSRELGPALHRDNYTEARGKIVALLSWAEPPPPEGEPGAPSSAGNGGAGPPH